MVRRGSKRWKKVGGGLCVIGETSVKTEMIRNGWAVSHHSGTEGWEAIAREEQCGRGAANS